jgi:hypothetical protein
LCESIQSFSIVRIDLSAGKVMISRPPSAVGTALQQQQQQLQQMQGVSLQYTQQPLPQQQIQQPGNDQVLPSVHQTFAVCCAELAVCAFMG